MSRSGYISNLRERFTAFADTLRRFARSQDGAVMVEWVALAASLAISAVAISYIVMHGLHTPASNIGKQLQ
jgi:Flp pilus assembly pilin Flp